MILSKFIRVNIEHLEEGSNLMPSDVTGFLLVEFEPNIIDALISSLSSFFEIITQLIVQKGEVLFEAHLMSLHVLRIFVDFLEELLHLGLCLFYCQGSLIFGVFLSFIDKIEHSEPVVFGVTCNKLGFSGLN